MRKFLLPILFLIFSCEEPIIEGCTTSTGCNYNVDADKDDGSCVAPQGCNEWCDGDSLSVQELDCADVCGGEAIIDSCGVCIMDTLIACTQDCANNWGGTAIIDSCGVCDGNILIKDNCPQCSDDLELGCDGECSNTPKINDACNVCDGENYFDGNGLLPNGNCDCFGNVLDCNGICAGNTIKGCTGVCGDTLSFCSFYDIDGNGYSTATIGIHNWFLQNLRVTRYNNGDEIPYILYTTAIEDDWASSDGRYGIYNNDTLNGDIYGHLYNFPAIDDSRGICPEGSHVSSDEEWKLLEIYLGMSLNEVNNNIGHENDLNHDGWRGNNIGAKLAGASDLWNYGDLENNLEFGSSGFNALPSGYRRIYSGGGYQSMDYDAYFWTSTGYPYGGNAWNRHINYERSEIYRYIVWRSLGFSVRCVEDYIDCNGIQNGYSYEDECGVCDNIPENDCVQDCNGAWGGNASRDDCGICDNDPNNDCIEEVVIGNQVWMAYNLKTTYYNNGDPIIYVNDPSYWTSYNEGRYTVYNDYLPNADVFGVLYNWSVVNDERGICPDGYHVPSDEDFIELEMFLGISEEDANRIGSRGTDEGSKLAGASDLWSYGDLENNLEFGSSGFNALPSGWMTGEHSTVYWKYLFDGSSFWTSTLDSSDYEAFYRYIFYIGNSGISRWSKKTTYGYSIRCLKD